MLRVEMPASLEPERRYAVRVVLEVLLGIEIEAFATNRRDFRIQSSAGGSLIVADGFFRQAEPRWLEPASIPQQLVGRLPLDGVGLASDEDPWNDLPVLFGETSSPGSVFRIDGRDGWLDLDVFGTCFFLLTRYEEALEGPTDRHGRFEAARSTAVRLGFLHRPLVNEYAELLERCLRQIWPSLPLRQRSYSLHLSHDVDFPFAVHRVPPWVVVRHLAGDIVRRHDAVLAARRLMSVPRTWLGGVDRDLYNTFGFLLDVAEESRLEAEFYFLATSERKPIDGYYGLDDEEIRRLLVEIAGRGHRIGLHGSYGSAERPEEVALELTRLLRTAEELGIDQDEWGGRAHFLRWSNPVTWRAYAEAGLAFDTTLGFADRVGFRCGVCQPFPVYDLGTRRPLELEERPLLAMDGTLFDYMRLDWQAARREVLRLRDTCRRFRGDLRVLWHNNCLTTQTERARYRELIADLT